MRQTKKGRKTTRNFRTTKRKRGGMPPRLDERTIKYFQGLERRLENEKKKKSESPRKTLEYSEEAYKQHLVAQAQSKLDRQNAEIAEKTAANEAALAAKEEKAQKAAAAKALVDDKALKATNAKVAADEKRAAEAEKTRLAAEYVLKKKEDKAKAEVERKKLVAEKTAAKKAEDEKKAEDAKKDEDAKKALAEAEAKALAEAKEAEAKEAEAKKAEEADRKKKAELIESLDVEPVGYDKKFWLNFFPVETITAMQTLMPSKECVSNNFYIEKTDNAPIIQKLIVLYGTIASRLKTVNFPCKIVWKGTRAIGLNTPEKLPNLPTHDIDMGLVPLDKSVTEVRMKNLALHIAELTNHVLEEKLSVLHPRANPHNSEIVKLSRSVYGRLDALVDIGFTYKRFLIVNGTQIELSPTYNEKGTKCFGDLEQLYEYPVLESMKIEKEVYIAKYRHELAPYAYPNERIVRFINNLQEGLYKIYYVMGLFDPHTEAVFLGKQKEKELEFAEKERQREEIKLTMAQAKSRASTSALTQKLTKDEVQELLNKTIAESKAKAQSTMPSQSQKPPSNSTASKPSYPSARRVGSPAHNQTARNVAPTASAASSSGRPSSRL